MTTTHTRAVRQARGRPFAALAGLVSTLAVAGWMTLGHAPAQADDGQRAYGLRQPLLPAYKQECSECHVAYPPLLLPPASWQRLLGNLDRHYGVDASLDDATRQEISRWLVDISRRRSHLSVPPPEDRITRTRWFLHEHDDFSPATFSRPSIGSASNCAACHRGAAQGDFDEDSVRIPR